MPRLSDSIPKYRKHRASGQAVVTLSGQDIYLGPHGTQASKIAYDRFIGEWLAAGRPTGPASSSDLTVIELCFRYWQHASSYYVKGGSLASIKRMLRTLKSRYGMTPAARFGPLALKAVRQQFVDEGLSRTYCNRLVDLIRRMFKWGASEQLVPSATWQALTTVAGLRQGHTPAPENPPILPVDDAVVNVTMPFLLPTVADMVRLQRLTGMRPEEVCSLRPSEVECGESVWQYCPQRHKTAHHGKQRTVFIGPKGQAVLRPYLVRDAEAYCFSPVEVVAGNRARRSANYIASVLNAFRHQRISDNNSYARGAVDSMCSTPSGIKGFPTDHSP